MIWLGRESRDPSLAICRNTSSSARPSCRAAIRDSSIDRFTSDSLVSNSRSSETSMGSDAPTHASSRARVRSRHTAASLQYYYKLKGTKSTDQQEDSFKKRTKGSSINYVAQYYSLYSIPTSSAKKNALIFTIISV